MTKRSKFEQQLLSFSALILVFLVISLSSPACSRDKEENSPDRTYVIMLSIDGCRWDYPDLADMPNLDLMEELGVKAEYLIPSYPTKTFPNHYSIATGLYPDHHGIVQNNFYDPATDSFFTMGNRSMVEDSIFWEGEAIWETAESQGVRTAAFYWVGTETNEYFHPSIRKYFNDEIPFGTRIDSAVSWLYLPEKIRPHLVLFYFEEPDGVGHTYGPGSDETKSVLSQLDSLIGVTIVKIEQAEADLDIEINFIVTSDHGMGYIPPDQYIFLDDYLDLDDIIGYSGSNPSYSIQPVEGENADVISALSAVPHLKVWTKEQLPPHYHYGTHKRIFDIIIEADPGWGLEIEKRNRAYSLGTHGYDPGNPDMHAIFYAMGPAFKSGYSHVSFENVCIYPLLAEILDLDPAPTDGKLETVRSMLKDH